MRSGRKIYQRIHKIENSPDKRQAGQLLIFHHAVIVLRFDNDLAVLFSDCHSVTAAVSHHNAFHHRLAADFR